MIAEIPTVATVLKKHGYSVTKSRQAVFNALTDTGPITMAQLVNKVHAHADRASVYRTVELFEKLGIVNRLQIGWKYKLELSDLFTEHHHHATCLQCGTVISLEEDESLERGIRQLAADADFVLSSHSLEIRGLCGTCSK
jgi:Fur family transcriptional regulator, ferric uptake regulator